VLPALRSPGNGTRLSCRFALATTGSLNISGALNGAVAGRIDGGSQASSALEQIYRPKFGFYGAGGGPELKVDYRRFVQWVS
jgi:hypothetical protein